MIGKGWSKKVDEVFLSNSRKLYLDVIKSSLIRYKYLKNLATLTESYTTLYYCPRTAVEKGEGSHDKEITSYSDRFDSFRLSLMFSH
jgi:hypothetical protein